MSTLASQPDFFAVIRQYPPELAWPLLMDANRYDWQQSPEEAQQLAALAAQHFPADVAARSRWVQYLQSRMLDPIMFLLWQDEWRVYEQHVTVAGHAVLDRVRREYGRMVAVSPHWDAYLALPGCLLQDGWRVNCQTEPQVAEWWGHLLRQYLSRHLNLEFVPMAQQGGVVDRLAAAVAAGWTVYITPDYNLGQSAPEAPMVPFVGGQLPATTGPARIALEGQVPLIGMTLQRTGPLAYTWDVAEPLYWPGGDTPAVWDLTEQVYRYLERQVASDPARWWGWVHRREGEGPAS